MEAEIEPIKEKIIQIYQRVAPGGQRPKDDGKGELDSMAFLEFIMLLETEFDVVIPAEEITESNFETADSTARYLAGKLRSDQ